MTELEARAIEALREWGREILIEQAASAALDLDPPDREALANIDRDEWYAAYNGVEALARQLAEMGG